MTEKNLCMAWNFLINVFAKLTKLWKEAEKTEPSFLPYF